MSLQQLLFECLELWVYVPQTQQSGLHEFRVCKLIGTRCFMLQFKCSVGRSVVLYLYQVEGVVRAFKCLVDGRQPFGCAV